MVRQTGARCLRVVEPACGFVDIGLALYVAARRTRRVPGPRFAGFRRLATASRWLASHGLGGGRIALFAVRAASVVFAVAQAGAGTGASARRQSHPWAMTAVHRSEGEKP